MEYEPDAELPVVQGGISAMQWDLTRQELEEQEERLKRKRPIGFAPWPQEEEKEIEKVDDGGGVSGESGRANARKPRTRRR